MWTPTVHAVRRSFGLVVSYGTFRRLRRSQRHAGMRSMPSISTLKTILERRKLQREISVTAAVELVDFMSVCVCFLEMI